MHQTCSAIFMLKIVLACFAILALTQTEYQAALGDPQGEPRRVVQAH